MTFIDSIIFILAKLHADFYSFQECFERKCIVKSISQKWVCSFILTGTYRAWWEEIHWLRLKVVRAAYTQTGFLGIINTFRHYEVLPLAVRRAQKVAWRWWWSEQVTITEYSCLKCYLTSVLHDNFNSSVYITFKVNIFKTF